MTTVIILLIADLAFIAALHCVSVFKDGNLAKIATYINLCLHIPLFLLLMALTVTIEVLALVYASSLLFYLVLSLCRKKLMRKEEIDNDL